MNQIKIELLIRVRGAMFLFIAVFLSMNLTAQANKHTVTGKVTDVSGEILPAVSVVVKGTSVGVSTNMDGLYTITIPEGISNPVLVFSFIGYTDKVEHIGNRSTINVSMSSEISKLDEVVVTALGIKREEKALGYSVQKIGGDAVTEVKGVDIGTSLTGKIAGLNVRNSTDFFSNPTITLRGATPLIVIDGVISKNVGLRELSADDIETFQVLKGGSASALYGQDGRGGAIMITTKRASKQGVTVSGNSNTMFHSGFLRLPKVHSSYSSGQGGKFKSYDEVWGDKLDIGRTAKQYNPYTYEYEEAPLVSKGKDNLKNFMETSYITNNNVNVGYKGDKGSFRASLSHIYNKGVFPNNKEQRIGFSLAGDAKFNEKLSIDASMTLNKRFSPQVNGAGYGGTGYIYNMMVWTGTDYDVREYRNYWKAGKEGLDQNWAYANWYNNPYLTAYETTFSTYHDRILGQLKLSYDPFSWLKSIARIGYDAYSLRDEQKYPISQRSEKKGRYSLTDGRSSSVNGDFIVIAEYSTREFSIDGLVGTSLQFIETNSHKSSTKGGLSIPNFYSLASGKDGVTSEAEISKYLTNSVYGKIGASWKGFIFVEATGRNDWSSTLEKAERSYFYPSLGGSFLPSEIVPLPEIVSFWKLRGSWSTSKITPSYNAVNPTYTINTNVWDGINGASPPASIRPKTLKPARQIEWEIGTNINFVKNRFKLDIAYYQKTYLDDLYEAEIAGASGYTKVWTNLDQERVRKGWEISLDAEILKTKDFEWHSSLNWTRERLILQKKDSQYAEDRPWVYDGARLNVYSLQDWQKDPHGNLILTNGLPTLEDYPKVLGYKDPDWIWGFSNVFKYKNFTLLVSFDGRVGGYGWDQTSQAMWHSGSHIDSDVPERYEEVVNGKINFVPKGVEVTSGKAEYDSYGNILSDTRVYAPNDKAISYQEYMKKYNAQPSGSVRAQWVNDMTFLKLRELSLSYKIPKQICEKLRLNNVEFAFVGQNLFIWSKNFKYSDPDGSYSTAGLVTPSVRYLGFNLKFDF